MRMQKEAYLSFLIGSAIENSSKTKSYILKSLVNEGIISIDSPDQMHINAETVDISSIRENDRFDYCMKHIPKAQLYYEKWEFIKDYKYSVLFDCDDFQKLMDYSKSFTNCGNINEYENEYIYGWQWQPYKSGILIPTSYSNENITFLKFNFKFEAMHPQTGDELLIKYPFLIVLHENFNTVEFRFDSIKRVFITSPHESTIYSDLIKSIKNYIERTLDIELSPIDLNFMISESKDNPKIKLIAQYMKLPKGGAAELDVGNNQEYILPFIDEIRSILNEHQTELSEVPKLKDALEGLMHEYEEMADYPWVELSWTNEIKTRSVNVKFIFNYMSNDYCLLQHYCNNVIQGMGRLNNVVKYIIEHRKDTVPTNG